MALIQPRRVPWDAPRFVYLHTLTFADPEPSYQEARARFRSFQTWLDRTGKYGVCVPEFGKTTRRLHFHLVSSERWDAGEMWEVCKRYGFGRYDVRARPAWRSRPNSTHGGTLHEAAWYLAKYVGKRHDWPEELKGARQWSVFGAKRFPAPPCGVRDVRITEKVLTVVKESPRPFSDFVEYRFPGNNCAFRAAVRPDAKVGGHCHMKELTNEQTKKLLGLLASGDIVGIGEYRVGVVETKDMEAYSGGKPTGRKVARVIVTHRIDFGNTLERREFDELLPDGAKAEAVTFPAKSGDIVAVCVDGMRAFQGGTNYKGRVVKL